MKFNPDKCFKHSLHLHKLIASQKEWTEISNSLLNDHVWNYEEPVLQSEL